MSKNSPQFWKIEIQKGIDTIFTQTVSTGKLFLGFDCAISISSRKRIADKLGDMKIEKNSSRAIVGIAERLNPLIRGWVNYFAKFRGYELSKVFRLLRWRIICWARKRYKRYRHNINKACKWYDRVKKQFPNMFYHWKLGWTC